MIHHSMKSKCKHNRTRDRRTVGYTHCVNPRNCVPTAHGNVVDEEECLDCGATRKVASNQRAVERGPWTKEGR